MSKESVTPSVSKRNRPGKRPVDEQAELLELPDGNDGTEVSPVESSSDTPLHHEPEVDVDPREQSVRRYLQYIADPSILIDHEKITAIEESLANTSDLIMQLRLHTELERAKAPDAGDLRAGFIRDARGWANANSVPFSAFLTLGLDDDVLRRSGLVGRGDRGAGRRRKLPGSPPAAVAIAGWAQTRSVPFSIREAATNTGFTPAMAAKAIGTLVKEGKLVPAGHASDHRGKGRSPMRFLPAS